jgi:hypothetical protein
MPGDGGEGWMATFELAVESELLLTANLADAVERLPLQVLSQLVKDGVIG